MRGIPFPPNSGLTACSIRDIQASSKALREAAVLPGPIDGASREKPDGTVISWELTDPCTKPLNGAVPFLINWGSTVHASEFAPPGGQLVELTVTHPEADAGDVGLGDRHPKGLNPL
jgi:hypothetical protein